MPSKKPNTLTHQTSDTVAAIEYCYERGWTDGLPVVPPTEEAVRAMLNGAALQPEDEIVFVGHRNVSVGAEKVAINAVMAGCRPEYMPVIVATLEAMMDPLWGFMAPRPAQAARGS